MLVPDISGRSGPKFMALADAIAEVIESGELEPDTKLPPQRILSYRLSVTVGTVTRAYQELERRGLTEPKVGSGTYVRNRETELNHFYHPVLEEKGIDLARCRPLLLSQPKFLASALKELSHEEIAQAAVLDYYSADGIHGHNETLRQWLMTKFNINIDARRLVWTHGGQHGISLIIQSLSRPKDTILAEGLCYPEFIYACQQSERKLVPVRVDEYGLDPEDLALHCKRHRPKLLYLTPGIQNPTGAQLTDSRRLKIIEICRRYNVLIIEDDVLYCPPSHRKSPLVAIAPDITLYVGSFSKYFAGGLRLGFIMLPLSFKDLLQRALRASCMYVSPLIIDLVCRWLNSGAMQAVDEGIAMELSARHRIWKTVFPEIQIGVPGYNVWLPLPEPLTGYHFNQSLLKHGVRVREAEMFTVGRYQVPAAVRISLAGPLSRPQLQSALDIVRDQITRLT
ncbi:PLP-dependent aminotransferase family protein [Vibrio campbellii]|uniref:PLP-dependent aminotransferase family protein n=1 Tax=Vibrio campbellii TaxID=680 RepID=A0ABY5IQQ5_9VIBR|nr:PLP-dependent aminotransferase family protein [Vibrio campbellii]UTZ25195.1 PLP-dependent aminotransferase family protein [Vibrio campbellii]UTZ35191.1 PLP-dependent aminotransferase family protein [Vibrio campbellii]